MIDIEKEREAFERWIVTHCDSLDLTPYDKAVMFDAWQAAKTQAIPEGFVLMPKESTQQIYRTFYDAFNSANAGNTARCFKVAYKAMIEAQEQSK